MRRMAGSIHKARTRLDLARDIRIARQPGYTGFPGVQKTEENVKRLYDQVLAQYLDR